MKKILFTLSAAALLAVGCAENSVVDENPIADPDAIGFEMGTGKVISRATPITTQGLIASGGIGIFATNGADDDVFINNALSTYFGGFWQWPGTTYKWPTVATGYPIDFYAYYPLVAPELTTTLKRTYTVDGVDLQKDHLAANKLAVYARPANSLVTLNFQHVYSMIDFKVTAGPFTTVEVQSVAVKNVADQRVFDYSDLTWDDLNDTFETDYSYSTATDAISVFTNTAFTNTEPSSITNSYGPLMLMPQNLSAAAWAVDGTSGEPTAAPGVNESYIEVVYRVVETNSGEDRVGFTDASDHPNYDIENPVHVALDNTHLFIKVGYPLSTNWEMSKAYTYVIHLGDPAASGGYLVTDNYIDEQGNEVAFPVIEGDVPDPIYEGTYIGFTTDVSPWEVVTPGIDL
jgi:hypothetical protein